MTARGRSITVGRGPGSSAVRSRNVPGMRSTSRGRSGRIQKSCDRNRGRAWSPRSYNRRPEQLLEAQQTCRADEARDAEVPILSATQTSTKVTRTNSSIHSCGELSLQFVTLAGLETSDDTNTIALNLMDYFLFSEANWLPELSYCKLHAACFLMASRVTGQANSAEQVAGSLGPQTEFIQTMAAPLAEDDDSAIAVPHLIGVDKEDAEHGYALLHERKEQLAEMMGGYAEDVSKLPQIEGKETEAVEPIAEEDLDLFEDFSTA